MSEQPTILILSSFRFQPCCEYTVMVYVVCATGMHLELSPMRYQVNYSHKPTGETPVSSDGPPSQSGNFCSYIGQLQTFAPHLCVLLPRSLPNKEGGPLDDSVSPVGL